MSDGQTAASSLLDLLTPQELQALHDSLPSVAGLQVSFGSPSGRPLTRPGPLPPACQLLRRSACREPEALCAFAASPLRRLLAEADGPVFGRCPYLGLPVAAVPLRVDGAWVAQAICRQAAGDEGQAEAWLQEQARLLRVEWPELRAALAETPAVGEERFRTFVAQVGVAMRLLSQLAASRSEEGRTRRALEVANRRLGALWAIAASVVRSSGLAESLGVALQTILDVLELASGAIFLRDEGETGETLAAHRGVGPEYPALAADLLARGGMSAGHLQGALQPWVVPDVTAEPDLPHALLAQLQMGAFVAAPLRAAQATLGTLLVHTAAARAFRADEVALIAAAAEQLGIGLQGRRLLSAEERRAGELAALNEVVGAVRPSLDPQVIAERALDAVLPMLRASVGMVYLLDDEARTPLLAAQRGVDGGLVRLWASRPPVGWDPQRGLAPTVTWGETATVAGWPDGACAAGLAAYICLPLRGQRLAAGLLVALSCEPRGLPASEAGLLQAVASQIGLALESARLYEQAQGRLADLEALQRFSDRILHTMQEGIFIINTRGQVSHATPRLAEISGYTVDELLGKDWSAFIRSEDRDRLQQALDLFTSGHSARFEVQLVRRDGALRDASVGVVPLFDAGTFTGLLGVVADVTEELRLRRRLQQAEKLSAIGELVSGVAHELNNPLTVIRGYAQLLSGSKGPLARRELRAIAENAERAARIVQGLLTFARERPPVQEAVDVNAVLESVLDMRERQLLASGVRVQRELAADLPRVLGDPYQLQQVFHNILTNAEQAIAEKGGGGVVHIRTAGLADRQVLVAIHDSGPGIPAALAERIFDPFCTTKGDRQGSGLGLSICYGIVNAHHGRIWAESVEGQGATFFVALPAQEATAEAPARSRAEAMAVASPGQGRVLILEDEAEIARLMVRCLERRGCRFATAGEGRAALQLLEEEEFDIILTDLKMPGMSGREFYTHLADRLPHLAERVIFVTGDMVSPETELFLGQCGRPHLAKPFSLDEMERMVMAALRERGV